MYSCLYLHHRWCNSGLHLLRRQSLHVWLHVCILLLRAASFLNRFHFMTPQLGHWRTMKSYHINHHYKNVDLGTSSPCVSRQLPRFSRYLLLCVELLLFYPCAQDLACPRRFGTMSLALCCLSLLTTSKATGCFSRSDSRAIFSVPDVFLHPALENSRQSTACILNGHNGQARINL